MDTLVFVAGALAALWALLVNRQYTFSSPGPGETPRQVLSVMEIINFSNFGMLNGKRGPELYKGLIGDVQLAPGSHETYISALVGACAVSGYCVLHLSQTRIHHKQQKWFLISGVALGAVMGTVLHHEKELGMQTTIAYIPICLVLAQALSIISHALLPSWREHQKNHVESSFEEKLARDIPSNLI
jgi:hypothetical protein